MGSRASATGSPRIKALAFDAFPVFDPRPIAALAESLYPGQGARLVELWRLRQFEYTWLRTAAGCYADFMHITADALVFATASLKLPLPDEHRDRLLGAYLHLKSWVDAEPVLRKLKASGIRLTLLSNFTPAMLEGSIKASGLDGLFEYALSTDHVRTYKPDPRAYQLGVAVLGLPKEEILFVAFASWDAAGSKAFGYPTFWVNRLGLPAEELGQKADGEGKTLADLEKFLDY
jgi:2-haloacid dehalogenase